MLIVDGVDGEYDDVDTDDDGDADGHDAHDRDVDYVCYSFNFFNPQWNLASIALVVARSVSRC